MKIRSWSKRDKSQEKNEKKRFGWNWKSPEGIKYVEILKQNAETEKKI